MFAVIYRWRVIPGLEAQFEEGWRAGTERIAAEFGGWGSRLHRTDDGAFIGTFVTAVELDDEGRMKRYIVGRSPGIQFKS